MGTSAYTNVDTLANMSVIIVRYKICIASDYLQHKFMKMRTFRKINKRTILLIFLKITPNHFIS